MTIDQKTDYTPHDCPNCGEPAYLGFGVPAKCTNRDCPFWDEDIWVEHVMALPDDETGVEFEIEDDEDTNPYINLPRVTQGLAAWLPKPKVLGPKSAAKQAKVTGGGQLNLPSWDDIVQEYLDGDDPSALKLHHHAVTADQLRDIAHHRVAWYRRRSASGKMTTGRSIVDMLDELDKKIDEVPVPFYLTDD